MHSWQSSIVALAIGATLLAVALPGAACGGGGGGSEDEDSPESSSSRPTDEVLEAISPEELATHEAVAAGALEELARLYLSIDFVTICEALSVDAVEDVVPHKGVREQMIAECALIAADQSEVPTRLQSFRPTEDPAAERERFSREAARLFFEYEGSPLCALLEGRFVRGTGETALGWDRYLDELAINALGTAFIEECEFLTS